MATGKGIEGEGGIDQGDSEAAARLGKELSKDKDLVKLVDRLVSNVKT
ncbi:MAG: hypothetical protein JRI58_13070 [Deltaproteobacteria bacterium]|nr:hypothetical protein [Deltaproteobacteria bacterium]MBW2075654.1 hypothetical protein [Deltaproteobacteria bacterium]